MTRRATLALLLPLVAFAADPRVDGKIERDADGRIVRSASAVAEFKRLYPCPVTGTPSGACPGWAVDHVIPLSCGGVDAPINMQWLPVAIKSASGALPKDRWERKVYCK